MTGSTDPTTTLYKVLLLGVGWGQVGGDGDGDRSAKEGEFRLPSQHSSLKWTNFAAELAQLIPSTPVTAVDGNRSDCRSFALGPVLARAG
jgi:hypothetical protein